MTREDTAVVNLQFANGAVATMTSTFAVAHGPSDHAIALYGSTGYLRSSMWSGRGERLSGVLPALFGDDDAHDIDLEGQPGRWSAFGRMWDDYAHAIRTGGRPRMTAADGRAAVQVIRAAYESIERGVTVPVAGPPAC
jgi:predicted dehydrogenase